MICVGLYDGSGNDGIHQSVMRFYPTLSRHGEEVVLSFIPIAAFQRISSREEVNTGRLAACFDLAAWFVDGLPEQPSKGVYELTKQEVKALSLGIWANILSTWLYGMGIVSCPLLEDMRMAICGIVMEKLAILGDASSPADPAAWVEASPSQASVMEGYLKAYPGMMGRLADMLCCCPDAYLLQPTQCPEALCRAVLSRSLRFFQHGSISG